MEQPTFPNPTVMPNMPERAYPSRSNQAAHWTGAALIVLALTGSGARGQNTPPADKPPQEPARPADAQPPTDDAINRDPELNDESVENALDEMRKRPSAAKPVGPTTRAPAITVPPAAGQAVEPLPGMGASDFGVPSARRLREGTFLSRREGTLVRAPTGDWIFVPRATAAGNTDRPMVLMPSQTLQRLEEANAGGGGRPSAVLSGQVFAYRGREYLLPMVPSSIGPAALEVGAPQGTSAAGGRPASAEQSKDPAVQDLIRDLESRRSPTRALTPPGPAKATEARAAAPNTPAAPESPNNAGASRTTKPAGLAENSLITGRRGRLVRQSGGELAFAVDSDADSKTEHALILLPCQTLGRMEDVTLWRGDGLALEVSGRILVYQGRNYLLPTMFVVPPPSDVNPLQ